MGKDFKKKIGSKRLNSLIPDKEPETVPMSSAIAQQTPEKEKLSPSPVKSNKHSSTVTTFRVNTEKLNQIKALAYWDRKKIQDVFDEALALYLDNVGEKPLETAVIAFKESQTK